MPFWKQSDDPWDRKPGKRRPAEPKEPRENPIDGLKAWNEQRKASAKEKEEARRLPPEKCPWCGKDMEQGYLQGGRDSIRWHRGIFKSSLFVRANDESFRVDDEEVMLASYKTTWFCPDCKKMVFNAPNMERYVPLREKLLSQSGQPDETKEKEESGE